MELSSRQKTFVKETLTALKNGARIGREHYSVTITIVELNEIINAMEEKQGGDLKENAKNQR